MTQGSLVGKTIGGYQIVRKLARNSNAVIYLAEDQKLHREVEFKVLDGVDARDDAFARRLAKCGFAVDEVTVRARTNGKGPKHVIWFATPN